MLLLSGFFLAALALVGFDLVVIFGVLRCPSVRRRLNRSVERNAQKCAAKRLDPVMQREWENLERLARKTESFNPRHSDVDSLLNIFLNIALAHRYALACAEETAIDAPRSQDRSIGALVDARRRSSERAQHAIESLGRQLETAAQRIRFTCDLAIADQCEAGAGLWLEDESSGSIATLCSTDTDQPSQD